MLTTVDTSASASYAPARSCSWLIGGIEALIIRLQLALPNQRLVAADTYNELFTMHGTTMIFLASCR